MFMSVYVYVNFVSWCVLCACGVWNWIDELSDVEDEAVKITAEEQMQITTLQNLENEINSG